MIAKKLDIEFDPDDLKKVLGLFTRRAESQGGWFGVTVDQEQWGTPALQEVTRAVPGVKGRVIAWVLSPGSERGWHADAKTCKHWMMGVDDDQVTAIHIPLQTNDQAFFEDRSGKTKMEVGEAWAIDITRPHRVVNGGEEPRIHLLLDTYGSDELRALMGQDFCRACQEEHADDEGYEENVSEPSPFYQKEEGDSEEDSDEGGEDE